MPREPKTETHSRLAGRIRREFPEIDETRARRIVQIIHEDMQERMQKIQEEIEDEEEQERKRH